MSRDAAGYLQLRRRCPAVGSGFQGDTEFAVPALCVLRSTPVGEKQFAAEVEGRQLIGISRGGSTKRGNCGLATKNRTRAKPKVSSTRRSTSRAGH